MDIDGKASAPTFQVRQAIKRPREWEKEFSIPFQREKISSSNHYSDPQTYARKTNNKASTPS